MSVTAYHFWSPTCAPCKAIKPSIDDLKEEFQQIVWVSVNTHDDETGLAARYSVGVVPTVVVETVKPDGTATFEKHSGTNIAGYYRILRSGMKLIQQS